MPENPDYFGVQYHAVCHICKMRIRISEEPVQGFVTGPNSKRFTVWYHKECLQEQEVANAKAQAM
jgi:hypothetical protein